MIGAIDGVDLEEDYFLDGVSQLCGDSSSEIADNAESDIDRNIRMAKQLNDSATGEELYSNCTELLINSGGIFGRSIVMNRVIRYYMTNKKLKQSKVKFRNADDDFITEVKHLFASTVKETQDWRNLMKVILQGVDLPKVPVLKAATIAKEAPVERESDVDRVSLLACALTDKLLAEYWIDLAEPIPSGIRPAVLDGGAKTATLNKWNKLADRIMSTRHLYANEYSELTVQKFLDQINIEIRSLWTFPFLIENPDPK